MRLRAWVDSVPSLRHCPSWKDGGHCWCRACEARISGQHVVVTTLEDDGEAWSCLCERCVRASIEALLSCKRVAVRGRLPRR